MTTLSKIVDMSSCASVDSLLQHTQKDDVVFLAFILLSGIFYNLYIKEKPDPYNHIWFEKPQQTDANARGADTRDIGIKLDENVSVRTFIFGSNTNYRNRKKTSSSSGAHSPGQLKA